MAETLSCFGKMVRIQIMQMAVYFRLWKVHKGTGPCEPWVCQCPPARPPAGNTPVTQQGGISACCGKEEPTQWGSVGWLCQGALRRSHYRIWTFVSDYGEGSGSGVCPGSDALRSTGNSMIRLPANSCLEGGKIRGRLVGTGERQQSQQPGRERSAISLGGVMSSVFTRDSRAIVLGYRCVWGTDACGRSGLVLSRCPVELPMLNRRVGPAAGQPFPRTSFSDGKFESPYRHLRGHPISSSPGADTAEVRGRK